MNHRYNKHHLISAGRVAQLFSLDLFIYYVVARRSRHGSAFVRS